MLRTLDISELCPTFSTELDNLRLDNLRNSYWETLPATVLVLKRWAMDSAVPYVPTDPDVGYEQDKEV